MTNESLTYSIVGHYRCRACGRVVDAILRSDQKAADYSVLARHTTDGSRRCSGSGTDARTQAAVLR